MAAKPTCLAIQVTVPAASLTSLLTATVAAAATLVAVIVSPSSPPLSHTLRSTCLSSPFVMAICCRGHIPTAVVNLSCCCCEKGQRCCCCCCCCVMAEAAQELRQQQQQQLRKTISKEQTTIRNSSKSRLSEYKRVLEAGRAGRRETGVQQTTGSMWEREYCHKSFSSNNC